MYRKFNIETKKAKDTLRVTTQKGIRNAVHTLHRRYIVDYMQLNRKNLNAQLYTDHLMAKTKSLEGKTGAWIYTNGGFTVAYPCTKRLEVGDML